MRRRFMLDVVCGNKLCPTVEFQMEYREWCKLPFGEPVLCEGCRKAKGWYGVVLRNNLRMEQWH